MIAIFVLPLTLMLLFPKFEMLESCHFKFAKKTDNTVGIVVKGSTILNIENVMKGNRSFPPDF